MLTFVELHQRLIGLLNSLDGDLWNELVAQLEPPERFPKPETIHDLCFRDAKALAGYVPDLRAVMSRSSPHSLSIEEKEALIAVKGILNLAFRLPVLILALDDYRTHENLIELERGYRQTLVEIEGYLALTI
ncbi:MAG: hypothetical protein LBV23_01945 [Deltaproteobacteria bacterium]|jgi:hypothetical protein|nr:hypothetical protein [Deltaproteobacteria bacterium]